MSSVRVQRASFCFCRSLYGFSLHYQKQKHTHIFPLIRHLYTCRWRNTWHTQRRDARFIDRRIPKWGSVWFSLVRLPNQHNPCTYQEDSWCRNRMFECSFAFVTVRFFLNYPPNLITEVWHPEQSYGEERSLPRRHSKQIMIIRHKYIDVARMEKCPFIGNGVKLSHRYPTGSIVALLRIKTRRTCPKVFNVPGNMNVFRMQPEGLTWHRRLTAVMFSFFS